MGTEDDLAKIDGLHFAPMPGKTKDISQTLDELRTDVDDGRVPNALSLVGESD